MGVGERIKKATRNSVWRTKLITFLTMIYNFFWSVGKIMIGVVKFSFVYVLSGVYTLLLGFTKRIFVTNHGKEHKISNGKVVKINKEAQSMIMGILILISGVAFCVYMAITLVFKQMQNFGLIWAIFMAVCSFVEVIVAICNLAIAHRKNDILLSSLRYCNFVSALFAIVLTQIALLGATEDVENASLFNAITGMIAGVAAILIGVYLIVRAHKKNVEKKFKAQERSVDSALETIAEENEIHGEEKTTDELVVEKLQERNLADNEIIDKNMLPPPKVSDKDSLE